jgi:ATP-dependent helicase/nuclease subunit A
VRLSPEQEAALDLASPIGLGAGAGSGKTRVLIERYVRALRAVGFDIDAVLAVTFTKKATAEMVARVRERLSELIREDAANAAEWKRVRESLGDAWILTIDAFCHRVLGTLGPAAGFPARRTILTGGALAEVQGGAMRDVVDGIAGSSDDPDREPLRRLVRALGRNGLVEQLRGLINRRARSVPWAEAALHEAPGQFDRIIAAVASARRLTVPTPSNVDREDHALLRDLARIFSRVLDRYRALLDAQNACDFRQLLEDVERALRDPEILASWSRRFRHVLVDEFQDTDPTQWDVLRRLCDGGRIAGSGLFVVGDEKQAIFSFRDGDVATFRAATSALEAASPGARRSLQDNYRSSAPLVEFFNSLSQEVFREASGSFEATHAAMRAARAEAPAAPIQSTIELVVGRGASVGEARIAEHAALATRVLELIDARTLVLDKSNDGPRCRPATFDDVAILLRTRRSLGPIEAALTARRVPFKVLGGVGFFEQHEVRALRNLMRFLADPDDEIALLGVLRSALFGVPDSVLLAAKCRAAAHKRPGLWSRVIDLDRDVLAGVDTLPTPADATVLHDAVLRLSCYRRLADRIPGNELLLLAVRESDLLLTLDLADPSGRAGANVEKLLDLVRRHQRNGVATFSEVERSIALANDATDDPESQADPPASGRDAVSILTVHAAKGLEWPIVFVTGCEYDPERAGGRHASRTAPVAVPAADGLTGPMVHSVKASEESNDGFVRKAIKEWARRERSAEEKRTLYVAVTRARDHLVMTAAEANTRTKDKGLWIDWIRSCRPEVAERGVVAETSGGGPQCAAKPALPAVPAAPRPPDSLVTLRIPATGLATIGSCARRYFLEHVIGAAPERMPRGWRVSDESGESGSGDAPDALARGSIVHAALEGLACGVDPIARVPAMAAAQGVRGQDEVGVLTAHVRRALDGFARWPVGAEVLRAAPLAVEVEVPIDYGAGAARVVGSIDLLFRPPGKAAVVIDFKTNRGVPKDPAAASRFAEVHGYGDQLRAYAAAVDRATGGPVVAFVFFTETGLPVPIVGGGAMPMADARRRVDALLEQASEAARRGFPLTSNPTTCDDCPHRPVRRCPGASGA